MKQPDADPRYLTVEGCREMATEMDALAHNAELLVRRHRGWARALRSRAEKIDQAETLELEAKAARMKADQVANQPKKEHELSDVFAMFGLPT